MAEDEDDLEEEELSRPPPPSPVEVARRALVLSGVVCRAFIENYKDEKARREMAQETREWFDELGLWPYLEPYERAIIDTEFGTMDRHLNIAGTWFVEGLAILAWALQRSDFPPHEKQVNEIAVTNSLDFLCPDAADMLVSPTLRPAQEIDAAREWFYDVHCTLRGFLNWNGDGHLGNAWIGRYVKALGLKRKTVMAGKGLAFEGKPLAEAPRERLEQWEHVICERHRASMWLVGDEAPYTEISVDT